MSPDQERLLMSYLADGQTQRVSVGDKLDHLIGATRDLTNEFNLHSQRDELMFAQLQAADAGAASRLNKLEEDSEVTDRHDLASLQAQLDDRKKTDSKRKEMVIAALVSLLLGAGAAKILGGR